MTTTTPTQQLTEWVITYPVLNQYHGRVYVEGSTDISIEELINSVSTEHILDTEIDHFTGLEPDELLHIWKNTSMVQVFDEDIDQDITFYYEFEEDKWVPDPESIEQDDFFTSHFFNN